MKNLLLPLFFLSVNVCANAQTPGSGYDQVLADSLGADQYGMKAYILVILKTGSAVLPEKRVVDSLFKGHMENIGRLVGAGKLIVAGPLKKNDQSYRGIFILNVLSLEEAKLLIDTDPAIKAQLLAADMFQWYGSAALPMYLPLHSRIQKSNK